MVSRIRSTLSIALILCTIIAVLPAKTNATAYSADDSHKCFCAVMCDCCDKATASNRNHLSNGQAGICLCSQPRPHQKAAVPERDGFIVSPMPIEIISAPTSYETPIHQVYFSEQSPSFSFILIPTYVNLRAPPVYV